MHRALTPIDPAQEYRDTMQKAARAFLKRHQGEHLADDNLLLDRTVSYLVNSLEVPLFMAPRLAYLALTELEGARAVVIGIDPGSSDGDWACIVDRRNGDRALVRYRLLPTRFQPPATVTAAAAAY